MRQINDLTAVVDSGKQRTLLLSSLPLRAPDKTGHKVAASSRLVRSENAYAPEAPLVPLRVEKRLRDGFSLAGGIRVFPVMVSGASARILGETAFFANAAPDTDALVRATPLGAEALWQVRSDRSPERYRLRFSLPSRDTVLRMRAGRLGGAEIVAAGRLLFSLPTPTAVDAAGRPVPVKMTVAGDLLTVTARHTTILVRPGLVGPLARG